MKLRKLALFAIPCLMLTSCETLNSLLSSIGISVDLPSISVPSEITPESLKGVFEQIADFVDNKDHVGKYDVKLISNLKMGNTEMDTEVLSQVDLDEKLGYSLNTISTIKVDKEENKTEETLSYESWFQVLDTSYTEYTKQNDVVSSRTSSYDTADEAYSENFDSFDCFLFTKEMIASLTFIIYPSETDTPLYENVHVSAEMSSTDLMVNVKANSVENKQLTLDATVKFKNNVVTEVIQNMTDEKENGTSNSVITFKENPQIKITLPEVTPAPTPNA